MASAYIIRRKGKTCVRFAVRYRLGGRESPVQSAGNFETKREAKARRDLVAGELAACRNPTDVLRSLTSEEVISTFASVAGDWQASRIDVSPGTRKTMASHLRRIVPVFGDMQPETIAPADVNRLVALLAQDLAPGSVKGYVTTLRLVLDFAGLEPNPARHRTVKLPRLIEEPPNPPTADHFLAIVDNVPGRFRLPLLVMEQTAMRVGETVALTWADVDESGSRFRIRASVAKTRRTRWAQVPDWLMQAVSETTPPDDRVPERPVFHGVSRTEAVHAAMKRACKAAGIPHYHPHDLRHRRLTLWHGQGVPARELATRAGHSKPSMTLDVYTSVTPVDEAPFEQLTGYVSRSGGVSVVSRHPPVPQEPNAKALYDF